jgi:hypothetical protein
MAETKRYQGGCHCGAVRYEAELDLTGDIVECNCSHCEAKGFLLTFTGAPGFTLKQGDDKLTEYTFNKHAIRHQFCRVCGVQSFAYGKTPDGKDMAAVNVRCLDGVDLAALKRAPFNGRAM